MRSLILALGLAASGLPAFAQDVTLLIGNERYDTLDVVPDAAGVEGAVSALAEAGVEVVSARNADRADTIAAIRDFARFGADGGGQAAVLVGRFGEVAGDVWFLPVEATGEDRIDIAEHGVPVALLARILSGAPGRAILVLGAADPRALGEIDLPQGVTLAVTRPEEAIDFARDTLARPGAALAAGLPEDARTGGFFPSGLSFLPVAEGGGSTATDPETAYWLLTRKRDEPGAYRSYLGRFPDGAHAPDARERLSRLTESPEERAERGEAELDLSAEERRAVQQDLTLLGHDTRGVDGIFGPGTRAAIRGWQEREGFDATGFLTDDQVARLDADGAVRAEAVEAEEQRRRAERRREDDALWSGMGSERSEAELANYLDRFPDGAHASEARNRLAALRDTPEDDGGAGERERQIWQVTQQENTARGYQIYLNAFPDGAFVGEARAALDRLNASSGGVVASPEASGEGALGLTQGTRRAVEQNLGSMGFDPGPVDGTFDSRTRSALRRYQQSAGLPATGYVNQATAVRLLADSIRGILQ